MTENVTWVFARSQVKEEDTKHRAHPQEAERFMEPKPLQRISMTHNVFYFYDNVEMMMSGKDRLPGIIYIYIYI